MVPESFEDKFKPLFQDAEKNIQGLTIFIDGDNRAVYIQSKAFKFIFDFRNDTDQETLVPVPEVSGQENADLTTPAPPTSVDRESLSTATLTTGKKWRELATMKDVMDYLDRVFRFLSGDEVRTLDKGDYSYHRELPVIVAVLLGFQPSPLL